MVFWLLYYESVLWEFIGVIDYAQIDFSFYCICEEMISLTSIVYQEWLDFVHAMDMVVEFIGYCGNHQLKSLDIILN